MLPVHVQQFNDIYATPEIQGLLSNFYKAFSVFEFNMRFITFLLVVLLIANILSLWRFYK